jgi:hypothetical protein
VEEFDGLFRVPVNEPEERSTLVLDSVLGVRFLFTINQINDLIVNYKCNALILHGAKSEGRECIRREKEDQD